MPDPHFLPSVCVNPLKPSQEVWGVPQLLLLGPGLAGQEILLAPPALSSPTTITTAVHRPAVHQVRTTPHPRVHYTGVPPSLSFTWEQWTVESEELLVGLVAVLANYGSPGNMG